MNEIIEKEEIKIEDMIYEIRGIQVMLDSDLGKVFKIETGNINKAMKRNFERFPKEFCFQLTEDEYNSLLFQIGIAKKKGGRTTLPYVYSEQGVAMLSSVLRSDIAISMSIKIINTFVKMRHFIKDNVDIFKSLNNVNNKLTIHDEKLDYLFSKFEKKEQMFLKGQVFEAYKSVLEILNTASKKIIIVDSYADINLLELIKNVKCDITLITKNSDRLSDILIEKYNKQYNNLKVVRNNDFHDRIIVIDNKEIYLLGSSINSIGEKNTSIIKLENIKAKKNYMIQ